MRLPLPLGFAVLASLWCCASINAEPPPASDYVAPDDLTSARSLEDERNSAAVVDPNDLLPESPAPDLRPARRLVRPTLDEIVNNATAIYLTKFTATDPHVRQQVTAVLRHAGSLGPTPGVGKYLPNIGVAWVAVPWTKTPGAISAVTIVFATRGGSGRRTMSMGVSHDTFGGYGVTVEQLTKLVREHDAPAAKR